MLRFVMLVAAAVAGDDASAADKAVEDLLLKMRKAYQAVQSVSLSGKARVSYSQGEETHTLSMDYVQPGKMRLVFDFRGQIIRRVSDGTKVYTWPENEKSGKKGVPDVSKWSLDAMGGDAPINLESMCFFDWKRQLSTAPGANMEKSKFKLIPSEAWNGKDWIVLEESAYGQNVFARYFIDPKTSFIWRCQVTTLDREKFFMDSHLTKLTLNPKLPSNWFAPPA